MQKIALVTDDSYFWKLVEAYLGSINADITVLAPGASPDEIAGCGASLLIVGGDQIPSLRSPLRLVKTIVIVEGGMPLPEQTGNAQRKTRFLRWPVHRDQLLAETAAMLGIAPRKDFKALIRIFSPDAEFGVVGRSIDFSLTGMSFTADRYYSISHQVSIALSVPDGKERLLLGGRIARNWINEVDGSREYGVEFHSLDGKTAQSLKNFVFA
jgi:hypothetical protein